MWCDGNVMTDEVKEGEGEERDRASLRQQLSTTTTAVTTTTTTPPTTTMKGSQNTALFPPRRVTQISIE